ncbi:MAG: hypothetical protein FWD61_12250 [Phycisphaerales bacterium]|nr:hypothetical protein [Phycisphaerales bacterium]
MGVELMYHGGYHSRGGAVSAATRSFFIAIASKKYESVRILCDSGFFITGRVLSRSSRNGQGTKKLDEKDIVARVRDFLLNKERSNWHEDKGKVSELHEKGVDILMVGGKRNSEYFLHRMQRQVPRKIGKIHQQRRLTQRIGATHYTHEYRPRHEERRAQG